MTDTPDLDAIGALMALLLERSKQEEERAHKMRGDPEDVFYDAALWQEAADAIAALLPLARERLAVRWRPIEEAPGKKIDEFGDKWVHRALFAIKREWGWEILVGQCDAGDLWLGRTDHGSCYDTDKPTHFMPLPSPPDREAESGTKETTNDA
jgi:hypothetical protein